MSRTPGERWGALWGITAGGPNLAERVRAALDAGIDRVIVREVTLPDGLEPLLVAHPDRISLHATMSGAMEAAARFGCGLHLPSTFPVAEGRARWTGFLSCSVHRVEACAAAAGRTDAVLLAPVWAPTSKPGDTRPTLGPDTLTVAARALVSTRDRTRLIALGGITPARARVCFERGADGVAVLGGIFGPGIDPAAGVQSYRV